MAVAQLAHDAADGPHVDLMPIVRVPQEQFGGAIPSGGDIVGHLSALKFGALEVLGELTGEAEIADLERIIGSVDQQVLGLHVPVHDVISVAEGDTLDHLVDELPEPAGVDARVILLEDLQEVLLDILENQI